MKSVRYKSTLVYYDGPQVFEARDPIGGYYIAVMIEPENETDRFLIAGVDPERLCEFRIGTLDLRALLVDRVIDEWYIGTPDGAFDADILLQPQRSALAESELLPDSGFLLYSPRTKTDSLTESRARQNLASKSANLTDETKTVVGVLRKVDVDRRNWRLSEESGDHTGETMEDGPSLEGLTTGNRYRFYCIEKYSESETGKEQRKLFLTKFETASKT